jgi:hypothetical protein
MCYSSFFIGLAERNIPYELFNFLLADKDLSVLLCTCKALKQKILEWKTIFPMEELRLEQNMTNKMLANMIAHYSHKVNKVVITYNCQMSIHGYRCMALLHPYLVELEIELFYSNKDKFDSSKSVSWFIRVGVE